MADQCLTAKHLVALCLGDFHLDGLWSLLRELNKKTVAWTEAPEIQILKGRWHV